MLSSIAICFSNDECAIIRAKVCGKYMNTAGTGSDAKNLVTNGNKLIVYDGKRILDVFNSKWDNDA